MHDFTVITEKFSHEHDYVPEPVTDVPLVCPAEIGNRRFVRYKITFLLIPHGNLK